MKIDFLNNIITESQAYTLAWFWSRGNGRIQRTLKDIDILYTIRSLLSYTGEIYTYGNIADLNISNRDFRRNLLSAGCVKNKCNIQTYPIIPERLVRHFIRGIFDSYGTVYIHKKKYININIVYDETFLTYLRLYLDGLGISTKSYYRYTHTTTAQMMITKSKDSEKFLNFVYNGANYYLGRKFRKYLDYVQNGV